MKALRTIILQVILIQAGFLYAQDMHFSQYFNNPLFVNPAHAGNGINYVRASLFYRNQWNTVASPFRSYSLAVDKAVRRFGFGALAANNSAGQDGISQLNILGNLTYIQSLGEAKTNKIALGIQFGIIQKSFDPSRMSFDNQYTVDHGYDPNAPNGETFYKTRINRPDINAGILYTRNQGVPDKWFKTYAGITFSHVTQPKESFIIDENKLPIKLTANAGAGFVLSKQLELRPSVLFVNQDRFREINMGMLASFSLDNLNVMQLGIYNRNRDAVIAYAGYQVSNFFLGLSYDINTSALSGSSRSRGGFELSLTYVPKGKSGKVSEKMKNGDKDQDGVKDMEDECPEIYGEADLHGCPADDMDRDGVQDKQDRCPEVAGSKSLYGCPDQDRDGITDAEDQCPDKAGPRTTHGCPVSNIDADGDGIPDKIDECPFIKGTVATKGCPDTDKDGITDAEDDCPYIKGLLSKHGCPDSMAGGVKTFAEKMQNIQFETNQSTITLEYFDIIEHALDLLSENSRSTIIISGHTDNEGDGMYNMLLSQNRADAVKEYLVTHGVNTNRISTVAYGETKPLAENDNPQNKFKNRRVEINVIREMNK